MAYLDGLTVRNLRILRSLDIDQTADFNLITGDNGTGKTTVLEAIYLLGHGRSFRTSQPRQFICRDASEASVRGRVGVNELQFWRRPHKLVISINGTAVSRRELIGIVPVRKFIPQDHLLVEGGSLLRRQFLDWGPFHLDSSYADLWRSFVRVLRQRNATLKASGKNVPYWDNLYQQISEKLHLYRQRYWQSICKRVHQRIHQATNLSDCTCRYWPGWKQEGGDLLEQLRKNYRVDSKRGYTSIGPHRADILLQVHDKPASQQLSRGQQKMWNLAMNLAQVEHFHQSTDKKCVWLIDDLASELDSENFARITQMFRMEHAQYWLTSFAEHAQKFLDAFADRGSVQIVHLKS